MGGFCQFQTPPSGRNEPNKRQNSVFDLAFDNGANKSDSLTVGSGQKYNLSTKCYHASSNRRVGG